MTTGQRDMSKPGCGPEGLILNLQRDGLATAAEAEGHKDGD